MGAEIIARTADSFKLLIEVPYSKSMMESEEHIQKALNEGGVLATGEVLTRFDTDGSPVIVGPVKLTTTKPASGRASSVRVNCRPLSTVINQLPRSDWRSPHRRN